MNPSMLVVAVVLTGLSLDACVTAPACSPHMISVAAKERRPRISLESGALTSTPTGQVREALRESFVHEYWLRDSEGRWVQVSEATWTAAEPGERVQICR